MAFNPAGLIVPRNGKRDEKNGKAIQDSCVPPDPRGPKYAARGPG
jgi:hypothetical protein